jgi:thiamine-monophosphate kinase
VTVLGEVEPENIVRRKGAAPGDLIFVSGTLGDSALGMNLLGKGDESEAGAYLINRHIAPAPRLRLGRLVAEKKLATSMIDVSDGLLLDLERITVHQGTGAEIEIGKIPVSCQYKDLVTAYSEDRHEYALTGGEDYELLFTTLPGNRGDIESVSETLGLQITEIGRVTQEKELRVIDERGEEISLKRRGFVHFNN